MKTGLIKFILTMFITAACVDNPLIMPVEAASVAAEPTPTGAYYEYRILPQQTDILIKSSTEPHFAYRDTRIPPKNKLLVFIGGTRSYPSYFQSFCRTASSLGYHVININYPNTVSVRVCSDKTDLTCFEKFREEILFGSSQSSYVAVDVNNCITNRIKKLLVYLHKKYPLQGWNQYYTTTALNYYKFVVAGHSQGGGHAAYLAFKYPLDRLIVLSSPNDYSEVYSRTAAWCRGTFRTSYTRFYGLMHKRDEIVPPSQQYAVWKDMRMLISADTASADKSTYKYYKALYTNYDPNPTATYGKLKHNVPAMDVTIPAGTNGAQLKKVWIHLLGG
jgi:hypothetical protein